MIGLTEGRRREVVLLLRVRGRVDHIGRRDGGIVDVMLGLRGVVGNSVKAIRVFGIGGHLRIHVGTFLVMLRRHLHVHLLVLVGSDEGLVGGWVASRVEAVGAHAVKF